MMKDYAKKYKSGDLDEFKEGNEDEYTHLLQSVWRTSKYESKLRQLTQDEFEAYNERTKFIEENDEME